MKPCDLSIEILSQLMVKRAGHPLSEDRLYRLESALSPVLRANGFDSIDSLVVAMVSRGDERFEIEIVEALLNNETYFFRDRAPFDLLSTWLRDRVAAGKPSNRISIWCAGVSTGQEAYSLAMMLEDDPRQWQGWQTSILGTDVSAQAINRAREGLYTQFEVQRGLPTLSLVKHFEKSGNDWRISSRIRERVRFLRQDITRHIAPVYPPHDVILCRNMLLYLPADIRRLVFSRLRAALAPDGILVLGAAETVVGQTDEFESHPQYRGFYRPKALAKPGAMTCASSRAGLK